MSRVTEVLAEIESRGLSVTVSGADLRLQGPKERMDPELVGRIKAVKPELVDHLSGRAEPEGFAVTPLQRGYLIGRGDAVELGGVASHVYHEIEGCWDLERLEGALRSVVARHGMLRTRFTADGRQIEQESAEIRIGRLDLRGQSAERQMVRRLALRRELSHRVLPADRAPMVAADVTLLAEDRMVLHVGHDGLVMDGISMFLFFREWWSAYSGAEPYSGEEASFEAYIAALETARTRAPAERSRTYWLDRLDDLAPHPDLPLRTSPSAIAVTRFTQYSARLDAAAWASVKSRAAGLGLTPTVLLLAAYSETLARWGAGSRFTLTTTVANRPPIHPRIDHAIGNFSETLLVEVEIDRQLTFQERARALQARLRRDLDHRHFNGIEVLRELGRRTGAGQAQMPYTFNSAIGYVQADLDGSALELFGPEVATSSQTPQLWLNAFAFEQHGGVIVQFDAVDGLFPEGLIEDMVAGYQRLLGSLLGDEAWNAVTFDLLPEAQRERRRVANDTARPRPVDVRLPDAFLARAAAAPDAAAILTSQGTMTYGELSRRARSAAAWLQARQVGRDELVGLVMRRGPEQIVGILATLLAGAAYLPIDAALPEERKRYMLRDGRARCVLTNAGWQDPDTEVLTLDATGAAAGESLPALPDGAGPDDLAYVLYTSGTTGEPKGVMVSHRSVANVVADCNARFAVEARDRFFGISAFNFDLSVYDVFGALSAGAAIVLPDADRAADPAHWLALCAQFGVTVWNSVPAIVGLLCEQAAASETDGDGSLGALRLVMMSGDRIPPELPARLWRLKDDLSVISLGGPTETTIWNISHPVGRDEDGSRSIPYGRPNANNQAYILDADGLDAPDWVTGEICAAGTGLARGYWGDAARTAERFFDDERRGVRLYRTGDLGCYLPDGQIAIQGRGDFQLKVNGYRVEAGEVETRLAAIDEIKEAVVVCQSGAPDASDTSEALVSGDRLVAHVVAAGDQRPDVTAIRAQLGEHLPVYMTPSVLVWHESLPLTRNGKVDRAALLAATPSGAGSGGGGAATATANSELELELAGMWASVLRVPEGSIPPDLDFYELGGESLAAARILTKVRKRFGVGITLERMHEMRTVRAMAAHVEGCGCGCGEGVVIDPIVNHAAGGTVARGHQISFVRLGSTQSMDLAELHEAAGRLARGLAALGLGPGDRLGISAANSLEWVLLDLAALRLKAVTAGFEPGKFELDALPAKYGLKMLFTDRPFDRDACDGDAQGVIRSIGEVAALAAEAAAAEPVMPAPGFAPGFAPNEPTTIKFTSGSSGEPKGLAATAGSIDSSVSAVQELFQHGDDDNLFIFLPLSLLQQRFWIYSALYYGHDVTVSTYEAALPSLRRVRPTVVMGVPAFYEAAMAHIEGQARRAGAGTEAGAAAVRSAAQDLFGDRIRYLWTGSAPARAAMLRFFTDDAGLPLYEGYGLNEACIVAKNHPGAHREGSVGQVLPRKKVLFDQDGVISIHSEYPVNDRYEYAPPGESERMFLPGDVVRTGDVGYLDRDGFLYIQGRADDTIVLDNGRKVIVRPIEERVRGWSAIEECVIFCPDQTRLVAVISPAAGPVDEAAIAEHVARANAEAAADEQIARVVVAQPRFSIDNGLLTSQFKPRRAEIFELYRDRITGVGGV